MENKKKSLQRRTKAYYDNVHYGEAREAGWLWFNVEGEYRKIIDTLSRQIGGRVLDVSCGRCEFLSFVERNYVVESYGFDLSSTAVKSGRSVLKRSLVFVGNGEKTPLKGGVFDFVFCLGSLEHFVNIGDGVREIARVMKDDGEALIVVPNEFWLNHVILAFTKGIPPTQNQPQEYFTTKEGWKRILEDNGLRVVKTGKQNIPFDPRLYKMMLKPKRLIKNFYYLLLKLLPTNFCSHFVFRCRRRR
jgi:ubiquinone/menaquinone biosynthesis C-methylase UbiE